MSLNNSKIITRTLSICLFIGLLSCSLNSNNYKSQLSWLKGTWISTHQNRLAQETWEWNKKDKCYSASGFMSQDVDTFYNQNLKIHSEKEDIFLSVKTSSNTETKEAFFKLINTNSDSLVFQNIFDQYPLYIVYINNSPYLKTRAIGQKNGHTQIDSRIYHSNTLNTNQ